MLFLDGWLPFQKGFIRRANKLKKIDGNPSKVLGVFDMLSHVLLAAINSRLVSTWVPPICCPSESPGGKGTSYQSSWRSHFLLLTHSANTEFHISQGRGTGKSMCSATSEELLLLQHYSEIHSLCVLCVKPHTNYFLLSASVIPFGLPVYLQENKIKCYLWEGLNPSPGLCVFDMLFSFVPLPFNNVLLVTAQIRCFHWGYPACP